MKLIIKELPTGNKGNIFHLENWVCWISSHQAVGREAQTCTGSKNECRKKKKNECSTTAAKSLERVRAGFLFHLGSSLMRLNRTSIVSYHPPMALYFDPKQKNRVFICRKWRRCSKEMPQVNTQARSSLFIFQHPKALRESLWRSWKL